MSVLFKGLFVVAVSVGVMHSVIVTAQESDTEFKSVLVGDDDLRPLIDAGPSEVTKVKSDDLKSTTKTEAANAKPDTGSPDKDVVDGPISLIPGLRPISETPPPTPKPAVRTSSSPAQPKQPARVVSQDPAFDLGVSVVQVSTGPRVRGVFVGSPAQRAGIQPNDVITSVGGASVKNSGDVVESLRTNLATSSFPVTVNRRGRIVSIQVQMTPAAEIADDPVRPRARRRVEARTVSSPGAQAPRAIAQSSAPSSVSSPTAQARQPVRRDVRASQPVPARSQTVLRQPVPQQLRDQQPVKPTNNRPLIGDGGRLIGNGRVLNSALRIIRRN